jgi:hypothetical protein
MMVSVRPIAPSSRWSVPSRRMLRVRCKGRSEGSSACASAEASPAKSACNDGERDRVTVSGALFCGPASGAAGVAGAGAAWLAVATSSGTRVTMTRGAEASGAAQPANRARHSTTSAKARSGLFSGERFPFLAIPDPLIR